MKGTKHGALESSSRFADAAGFVELADVAYTRAVHSRDMFLPSIECPSSRWLVDDVHDVSPAELE